MKFCSATLIGNPFRNEIEALSSLMLFGKSCGTVKNVNTSLSLDIFITIQSASYM